MLRKIVMLATCSWIGTTNLEGRLWRRTYSKIFEQYSFIAANFRIAGKRSNIRYFEYESNVRPILTVCFRLTECRAAEQRTLSYKARSSVSPARCGAWGYARETLRRCSARTARNLSSCFSPWPLSALSSVPLTRYIRQVGYCRDVFVVSLLLILARFW